MCAGGTPAGGRRPSARRFRGGPRLALREDDVIARRDRMASSHDNALRAAFEAETLVQCHSGARAACWLAFLFVPAFALEDVLAGVPLEPRWLLPRLACLVGVAAVFG